MSHSPGNLLIAAVGPGGIDTQGIGKRTLRPNRNQSRTAKKKHITKTRTGHTASTPFVLSCGRQLFCALQIRVKLKLADSHHANEPSSPVNLTSRQEFVLRVADTSFPLQ